MRKWLTVGLGGLVWLWTAYTLYAVGRFGGAVVVDPETTARLMAVRNDGQLSSAVGLTYHGLAGAALVIGQMLVVGAALLSSLGPQGWKRRGSPLVLTIWTGLWLGNALWLRSVGWDHRVFVGAIVAAMVIVVAWSALRLAPQKA